MSADAFCLPSGDESQPIAPLEAAALGVPVLLTDLEPYADTWKHGVNCLLNPPGDAQVLQWNLAPRSRTRWCANGSRRARANCRGASRWRGSSERFDAELPV